MINESLIKKIEEVKETGEYGTWTKIYLSDKDILRIFRQEKFSLKNPTNYYHETVKEAIRRGEWDTCNGTMRYNITVATDGHHGPSVRLDEKGRAFIEILPGLKPGESYLGEQS